MIYYSHTEMEHFNRFTDGILRDANRKTLLKHSLSYY